MKHPSRCFRARRLSSHDLSSCQVRPWRQGNFTSCCSPAHSPVSLLVTNLPAHVRIHLLSYCPAHLLARLGPALSLARLLLVCQPCLYAGHWPRVLAVVVCVVCVVRVHASARPLMCVAVRELARPLSRSPTCRRPVHASLTHPLTGLDHPYSCTPFRLLARLPFLALARFMAPGCCPVCSFARSPSRLPARLPVRLLTDCRSHHALTLSFTRLSHAHTFACFPAHSSVCSFTRLLAACWVARSLVHSPAHPSTRSPIPSIYTHPSFSGLFLPSVPGCD